MKSKNKLNKMNIMKAIQKLID